MSPWEFRPTDRVPDGPPRPTIEIGPVSAMMGIAGLQGPSWRWPRAAERPRRLRAHAAMCARSTSWASAPRAPATDGTPVRRVRVEDVEVRDNTWGRGVSVVGGEQIAIQDAEIERSSSAGLYIASEGAPYDTFAPRDVVASGIRVEAANTDPSVGHGAVLVYAGRPDQPPTDVLVSGLTVAMTRGGTPWEVGVVAEPGAEVRGIGFVDVTVVSAGTPFAAAGVPTTCCTRTDWTVNGSAVPDVVP